jgi:hypothetical protein
MAHLAFSKIADIKGEKIQMQKKFKKDLQIVMDSF